MPRTFLCSRPIAACLAAALLALPAHAELDLRNVEIHELANGLTVLLLEDRNFPVVSVQALYRVGARNESIGKTGLAHFVEHMAFRSSQNFPDTGLVSEIYARGGEWHGYTWTDETTYFATVPAEHLETLLRIEADRIARLAIDPAVIDAERGAVLAEMQSYEDSPVSMLIDNLMFTMFQAHPYRNNTIGFASDIDSIDVNDVTGFYRQHYHPANAVLVVVGAMESGATLDLVSDLFGELPRRPATPLPHTEEPPQLGPRRVQVRGAAPGRQFMIGYRAPGVTSPDFPAFLLLQELLGTGSGVNFLQNDWGTPVTDEAALSGVGASITTWYPPSAQDYAFVIGGEPAAGQSASALEDEIERRLQRARETEPEDRALANARDRVFDELVFDVQTTEDAAHLLADFAGMGALDVLLNLPASITAVRGDDVRRVASAYLQPGQRSIAWYGALASDLPTGNPVTAAPKIVPNTIPVKPVDREPVPGPVETVTSADTGAPPILVQRSDLSDTAAISVVLPMAFAGDLPVAPHTPVHGYASLDAIVRPRDIDAALRRIRNSIDSAAAGPFESGPLSQDPGTRLEQELQRLMSSGRSSADAAAPVLIAISGNVEPGVTSALASRQFAGFAAPETQFTAPTIHNQDRLVELGVPIAQAQLGYIVAAPAPGDSAYDATAIALYVLSHGYEGRLGKEAISRRGLAYYIDARYRSDGDHGWVTIAAGVDAARLDALHELLHSELTRLGEEPPTDAEVVEAKSHLLGRRLSAAQSNEELVMRMAQERIWFGEIQSIADLERRLEAVGRDDVARAARALAAGLTIRIRQ